jgi:hypothetical protein
MVANFKVYAWLSKRYANFLLALITIGVSANLIADAASSATATPDKTAVATPPTTNATESTKLPNISAEHLSLAQTMSAFKKAAAQPPSNISTPTVAITAPANPIATPTTPVAPTANTIVAASSNSTVSTKTSLPERGKEQIAIEPRQREVQVDKTAPATAAKVVSIDTANIPKNPMKGPNTAALTPAAQMSFSDAVHTLKKVQRDKRTPGFRTKSKPGEIVDLPAQQLSLAELAAQGSNNREVKRKKTELDKMKEENKKLEREILCLMGEETSPIKEWTTHALPDITPAFPGYARLIGKDGLLHTELEFQNSSWCFDDRGKVVDLSKLIVGYKPVKIQDLVLISRLARLSSTKNGPNWARNPSGSNIFLVGDTSISNVASDLELQAFNSSATNTLTQVLSNIQNLQIQDHYLNRLADKQLEFAANSQTLALTVNLSKVLDKIFSVGIEVPILFQSNKISMLSTLTNLELDELSSAQVKAQNQTGDFFVRYPNGLFDFYRDLLAKKGFIDKERHNLLGIGDVSLFVNRKINAPEFVTAGMVGLGITAPSGVKTDMRYLYPSVLGNGGFWEVRAHTSLFWRSSGFFNPHLFAEFRFRVGSSVDRRISRVIDRKQTRVRDEDGLKAGDLPMGSGFVYNPEAIDFKQDESLVPAFAQEPLRSVDINRGVQAKVRVGNLFNGVLFDQAYLDAFYEAEFEQEDNVGFRQINPEYDVDRVMLNTRRQAHSVGAVYCYRLNDDWLLEGKFSHIGIGKNSKRAFKFGFSAQYNF